MTTPATASPPPARWEAAAIALLVAVLVATFALLAPRAGRESRPAASFAGPVQPKKKAGAGPLAEAFLQYRRTLAGSIDALGDAVLAGTLAARGDVEAQAAAHGRPASDAMSAALARHCGPDGAIADPAGLARELKDAAKALRAPQ